VRLPRREPDGEAGREVVGDVEAGGRLARHRKIPSR
jgi:hypothetical protein